MFDVCNAVDPVVNLHKVMRKKTKTFSHLESHWNEKDPDPKVSGTDPEDPRTKMSLIHNTDVWINFPLPKSQICKLFKDFKIKLSSLGTRLEIHPPDLLYSTGENMNPTLNVSFYYVNRVST